MVNPSEDIRNLMDRLALLEQNQPEILNEGPFDGIRGALARRTGRKERAEMIAKLDREWNIWLGKYDREGTMDDLERFLKSVVQFNQGDVDSVLGVVDTSDDAKGEPDSDSSKDSTKDSASDDSGQKTEPATDSKSSDNTASDDEEDGRSFNLDDKLSDYGKVGDEANEIHGEPGSYKNEDGSWNEERIQSKLEQLEKRHGRGITLVLGDSHFSMEEEEGKEQVVQTESLLNEFTLGKLSRRELKDIWGRVVNHYMDNVQPRRSNTNTSTDAGSSTRSSSSGRSKNSADVDEMWKILQANGLSSQVITRLMKKAASSSSVSEMSDSDMKHLSLVGYAYFKASK